MYSMYIIHIIYIFIYYILYHIYVLDIFYTIWGRQKRLIGSLYIKIFCSAFVLVLALSSFFLLPSFFFHLGSSCPMLAPSGAILAPSWAPLGSILSHLGLILSHPGSPECVFGAWPSLYRSLFEGDLRKCNTYATCVSTLHFIEVKVVYICLKIDFPFGQELSETM